jgi:3-isopropylmalate/(R)-2-methylmalate dehydratase small subunit
MSDVIRGTVVRLGDDVNTDVMLPGKYLNITDPAELGRHLLETYPDPTVPARVGPGTILVAGRNCGMGSSREQAQLAMQGCGIAAVVAESFARIFQRNCLNVGLLAIEHAEAARAVADGATLAIDLGAGRLDWDGGSAQLPTQPPFVQELLAEGGIVGWVRKRLAAQQREAAR